MKKDKLKLVCLTGVFTALIFVLTAYIHIPSHTGYTHVGDGITYLAACILPLPYGVFAGACGALLADCISGFAIWAPGTVIIKAVTVLLFSPKGEKVLKLRNILALIPALLVCSGGYYIYESILTGNFISPLGGIYGYITQSVLSSLLYIFLGITLDKLKFKKYLIGGN